MIHDSLCPCKPCGKPHSLDIFSDSSPWACNDCQGMGECECDLIAKVRRDERNYILNLAADTIKNHKVQHGRCLCLAYVESEEQHRDDIIRRYVASALTRDGQEMGLTP